MARVPFRVSARAARLIGRENVATSQGAVTELVKNAYHEPNDIEFEAFLAVHKAAGDDPSPILDFGDAWLARHPETEGVDLGAIRRAWTAVRAHRMRHASRKVT